MFCLYLCLYTTHMPGIHGSQKSITSPGTGVTGGCDSPCEYWELNSNPLEDSQCLLTSGQSFQPPISF